MVETWDNEHRGAFVRVVICIADKHSLGATKHSGERRTGMRHINYGYVSISIHTRTISYILYI